MFLYFFSSSLSAPFSVVILLYVHNFYSRVGNDDWSAAQLLTEILRIWDDDFRVLSDGGRLSTSELNCILS